MLLIFLNPECQRIPYLQVSDVISRKLRKMQERKLIQIGRLEIHILNGPGLEEIAMVAG